MKNTAKPPRGKRLAALRHRLGITQIELARRSGVLRQSEVAHVETGRNQCSTKRVRAALARGFGLVPQRMDDYLAGRIKLDEIAQETHEVPARDEGLEAAINFFAAEKRWSSATIEAARAELPARDVPPSSWKLILDLIEAGFEPTMERARAKLNAMKQAAKPPPVGRDEGGASRPAAGHGAEGADAGPRQLPRRRRRVSSKTAGRALGPHAGSK